MFSEKSKPTLFLFGYGIILLASAMFITPYNDAYYYWDWGRHLSFSYYDGPPLIAYLMRLFSIIFGNNTYAIQLLGVTSIYLTAFFIFKTGCLLFEKSIALIACLLWILSPLVSHYLLVWVTYDNPLNLFWAITIFFSVRYIRFKKISDLYLIGMSAGFLLLSKYTGVVLLFALLLFTVLSSSCRSVWQNKHFYFAMGLIILIASPILIWNYQHDWISLFYQLNAHHRKFLSLKSFFLTFMNMAHHYNILLLLPLYALYKMPKAIKNDDGLLLLNIISFVFIIFFLYSALRNRVSTHWLAPYCISSALLVSYYFSKYRFSRLCIATLIIYFFWSMDYILSYSFFQRYIDGNVATYELAKTAGKKYLTPDMILITTHWETASKLLFWLPNKHPIYTLPCGEQNQYADWSKQILQQIKDKKIKEILYFDLKDQSTCMKQYFTICEPLSTLAYFVKNFRFNKILKENLYVYRCLT